MVELGQTDDPRALIHGDPDVIAANAVALRQRAADAGGAGDGLRSIDTGAWTGPAAERFHDKFSYEPGRWFTAADAMQAGAGGLDDYVSTLRWAQGQAAEAIRQWNAAWPPLPRPAPDTTRHRRRHRFKMPARSAAQPRGKCWRLRGTRYVQLLVW